VNKFLDRKQIKAERNIDNQPLCLSISFFQIQNLFPCSLGQDLCNQEDQIHWTKVKVNTISECLSKMGHQNSSEQVFCVLA
jgi:hypothetical protein